MTAPMNFRSAINGFKREDVVSYIEYLNARHTAELNQLHSEIEYLKTRAEAPAEAADETAEVEALKARIDSLLERCAQLEDQHLAAAIEAEDKLRAAEDRCAQLKKRLEEAQAAASDTAHQRSCHVEQELEAYRRAERAERLAQERALLVEKQAAENAELTQRQAHAYAEALCNQANAVLAEASLQVDGAAGEVSVLAESVMSQLHQLQEAIAQSKQALRTASDRMYAVRTPAEAK